MSPVVSIIMPVFNRRYLIGRAIDSVKHQSYTDWELIIVDDGSTDGTPDAIDTSDSRIRVLRQKNAGANAARNTGIAASRGRYIAFLDSDDEWLPHFLALTCAFLEHHPDEAFVATEFLEQSTDGSRIQDRTVIQSHLALARRLNSRALELPEGATDDYLRVYEVSKPLGTWSNQVGNEVIDNHPAAKVYSGHIGETYRWGHLHAMWCLLIRREAALAIGPIDEKRRSCTDLKYLVDLCRGYRANMISVPSVVKHELSAAERKRAAGHLSGGSGYALFNKNQTGLFHELFLSRDPANRELSMLYGLHCLRTAVAMLDNGDRGEAIRYLEGAREHLGRLASVRLLGLVARFVPTTRLASLAARQVVMLRNRREAKRDAVIQRNLSRPDPAAKGGLMQQ
jgi:glycosyltransferase involved in cell wall biosynthesis